MNKAQSIVDVVVKEMKRRGWTAYRLGVEARRFSPAVSSDTVYKFVAGSRSVTTRHLEPMLAALEITVSASPASSVPEAIVPASAVPVSAGDVSVVE